MEVPRRWANFLISPGAQPQQMMLEAPGPQIPASARGARGLWSASSIHARSGQIGNGSGGGVVTGAQTNLIDVSLPPAR